MGWNRTHHTSRRLGVPLLLFSWLIVGSLAPASGQVWTTLSNELISVQVGSSGQIDSINIAGRFTAFDLQNRNNTPPPATQVTPMLRAPHIDGLGQHVLGSYLTVRIDGGEAAGGYDLIFGDGTPTGGTGSGAWVEPPRVINNYIRAVWRSLAPAPEIRVELKLTLIHDVACFEFTIINNDTRSHTVGLRFAQDYHLIGPTPFRQGPIITPNTGEISTETSLVGSQVPTYWRQVDSDLFDVVGGFLRPISAPPPTTPDRFVVGNTAGVVGTTETGVQNLWDVTFTNDPTFNFATAPWDAAVALFFNPRQLVPGERRTIVTYFGKARANVDFGQPWAAGVDGPFSLRFDGTQPAGQQIVPDPFDVTAFVRNLTDSGLTNVSARINLPTGLELASGETDTKSIPSIDAQGEAVFNWKVRANGQTSGRLSYSVSFAAGPGSQGKVVTRNVDVPAVPTHAFSSALQMVSFPFQFADPTPSVVLGGVDFDLIRWNSNASAYEVVPGIQPGEGYWMRLRDAQTLALQGASPISTSTGAFQIPLKKNWNQIGNPFLLRVRWADVKVLNTNPGDQDYGKPVPISVASDAQHRWIVPALYYYDTATNAYKWDADFSIDLVPYTGYWVKALRPNITLLISPPSGKAASLHHTARAVRPKSANDWSLRIVAKSGETEDGWNFIGVAPDASNGYDHKDIEKPPAIQDRIGVGILRRDWGTRAGLYAQDIQATGGRKQWELVVTSPRANTEVTLSWPEIGALPRGYELYITDTATNQRRLMRQTSSLRVNTGETGSRAFLITGEPRSAAGAFRITHWNVATSGRGPASSARISFTASADADINVRILRGTGQAVRSLVTRAVSSGTTTVLWDYRDGKGVAVPAGQYMIEIKGTTTDGESARIVIPHLVKR